MLILLTILHILVCIFLILVVLLQQGKGADLSVFGGGGTQAAFGARGATTLLHKLTVGSFIAFVVLTMAIGLMTTYRSADDVLEGLPSEAPAPLVPEAPATTEPPPAAAPETEGTGEATPAAPATTEPAPSQPVEAPAAPPAAPPQQNG